MLKDSIADSVQSDMAGKLQVLDNIIIPQFGEAYMKLVTLAEQAITSSAALSIIKLPSYTQSHSPHPLWLSYYQLTID